MPRCLKSVTAALALAAPALVFAQSAAVVGAVVGTVLGAASSASQSSGGTSSTPLSNPDTPMGRAIPIPMQSLRGEILFGQPPEVALNGKAARLAPGARIRDLDNRLVLSGNLVGQKYKVNYTVDTLGLLMNVWILKADEAAKLWPTTPTEAATWIWDPVSQTWSKP
ncbi:hypothetical protein [Aquabacterium sp.]|uniref:hypothetical protein n=1 Tax=Aquabacterium sp. TaxID=1872578 RepID=UPI004037B739